MKLTELFENEQIGDRIKQQFHVVKDTPGSYVIEDTPKGIEQSGTPKGSKYIVDFNEKTGYVDVNPYNADQGDEQSMNDRAQQIARILNKD